MAPRYTSLRSAQTRSGVNDPERVTKVVAEARDMAEEDRPIIYNLGLDKMADRQKKDLIVELGAEKHSGQWRSTQHFRQAAMHVVTRELATVKRNLKSEATTTRLLAQLGRKAEAVLDTG